MLSPLFLKGHVMAEALRKSVKECMELKLIFNLFCLFVYSVFLNIGLVIMYEQCCHVANIVEGLFLLQCFRQKYNYRMKYILLNYNL